MPFLDYVLQPPVYGWRTPDGSFSKPSTLQIFKEFFSRLNITRDRRNWLPFFSWIKVVVLAPFFILFLVLYLNWWTLLIAFIYGMVIMGTHGTIWHHRYCTHKAYTFRNNFWRFITQHLTIQMIPEEIYVISHHVHHAKSDKPGDPYNANGGFLYCFLADVNHQPIAKDLSDKDYEKVRQMMQHTGVTGNSYASYRRWGSYVHPGRAIMVTLFNWLFWLTVCYMIGGFMLVCTIFGAAAFWAIGVRTFNYEGHGKGKDKQRAFTDFNTDDKSVNQLWPGIVAGEWHNNHHLYPRSARSGFKPFQIDFAWYYIYLLKKIGGIRSYRDAKKQFYEKYYTPFKKNKKPGKL